MTKQDIIKDVLANTKNVTRHGTLNEKVLLELKMTTSLYDFIEVVTNYYDDEERPDFNNWTDVEGFGYGWRWMNYEEKDWHKMMSRMVAEECDKLMCDIHKGYYLVEENESTKTYQIINISDCRRVDTLITFSNEEVVF